MFQEDFTVSLMFLKQQDLQAHLLHWLALVVTLAWISASQGGPIRQTNWLYPKPYLLFHEYPQKGVCTIFFIIDGTNKVERIRNHDPRRRGRGRKEVVRLRWLCLCQLTEKEEINASLGVPHLFLGNVGRLSYDRISRYFCNKCRQEHSGPPTINYENPGEELPGEGLILVEKGQYLCGVCSSIIAIYCKFRWYLNLRFNIVLANRNYYCYSM